MKCPMWVVTYGEDNKKEPVAVSPLFSLAWVSDTFSKNYPSRNIREIKVCDGLLKVSLELESAPYFGGCDHVIDVRIACNKCGNYSWPPELGIPNSLEDVTRVFQAYLDSKE